jgi:hypothetical protein
MPLAGPRDSMPPASLVGGVTLTLISMHNRRCTKTAMFFLEAFLRVVKERCGMFAFTSIPFCKRGAHRKFRFKDGIYADHKKCFHFNIYFPDWRVHLLISISSRPSIIAFVLLYAQI